MHRTLKNPHRARTHLRLTLLTGAALFLLLIILTPALSLASPGQRPSRVLFDEEFSWLTREGADRLLSRAQAAGFDTIVPCVWHGRGVTWPSDLAPKEPKWEKAIAGNTDPLLYLITRAHAMGLQVHPWFTVGLRQRDFFPEFAETGTPEKAFNWHHAGFRTWIVNLILEVVSRYDVDGINLDYVRTKGHCTSASCLRNYQITQQRDLQSDLTTRAMSHAARQSLMSWNSLAVGNVVERVAREGRQRRAGLVVTIDSLAGDDLWMEQGANGLVWAQNGWIDLLYHMDYGDPLNTAYLSQLRKRVSDPTKVTILIGNYESVSSSSSPPTPRAAAKVQQLLAKIRQLWSPHMVTAIYEYRFMTDEQMAMLQKDRAASGSAPKLLLNSQ
ncbi:MAG: family 10 glycosylhydrolase [Nitrospira sp.]